MLLIQVYKKKLKSYLQVFLRKNSVSPCVYKRMLVSVRSAQSSLKSTFSRGEEYWRVSGTFPVSSSLYLDIK